MRYLLIDRILFLQRHQKISALKNVALSEDVFADHFMGFPVMPGALMIEAAAQAGTALLEVSLDYKKKAILVMVERAKFRAMVTPGDQLQITGTMLSLDDSLARVGIEARVGEKLVMDGRLAMGLREPDQFYPPESMHVVKSVYECWLRHAELVDFD
ncbi:MAG: beta-hydroxyacyl-ACP dehydratase [Chromatiales bacterium]|nr:MAG: beta-hydroxyacyl-ACP dehydratase [Chromatiales bacterium]